MMNIAEGQSQSDHELENPECYPKTQPPAHDSLQSDAIFIFERVESSMMVVRSINLVCMFS